MAKGYDTALLWRLAGLERDAAGRAAELFERCLAESNLSFDDRTAAGRKVAECVGQQIADLIVDPYDGAEFIHRAAIATGDESFHDLDPFIYASSEWEDDRPTGSSLD